ncbi:MAG: DJ-1/PfpI family protein [Desulfomonilaceae bacterium]
MRFCIKIVTVVTLIFAAGLGVSHGKQPTVLLLVSPTMNHPVEYSVTRQVLESSQCKVRVACKGPSAKDLNGANIPVDLALEEVRTRDYDALAIIGGYSVWKYMGDPEVNRLLHGFCDSDKLIGAICAGTYVLGKAGLLKGRRVTGPRSEKLRKYGAQYVGGLVQQDEKIITAKGPSASKAFGKALVEALRKKESLLEERVCDTSEALNRSPLRLFDIESKFGLVLKCLSDRTFPGYDNFY